MIVANQFGRGFGHHGGGWGLIGLLLFLLLLLILAGVVLWVALRPGGRVASVVEGGVPPRPDPAVEEVRLRYARGEISREEFVQRSRDLGGSAADPSAAPAPPAG